MAANPRILEIRQGVLDKNDRLAHDLRQRFRTITFHTERVIDSTDPTQNWAEIGAELEDVVATAVGDNFVWAYRRAEALAAEVARTFTEVGLGSVRLPEIDAREMGAGFEEFRSLTELEAKPLKLRDSDLRQIEAFLLTLSAPPAVDEKWLAPPTVILEPDRDENRPS